MREGGRGGEGAVDGKRRWRGPGVDQEIMEANE